MIDWKVNETRKRSLLKAASFRAIEIAVATALIHFWGKLEVQMALKLAIVSEATCFGLYYGFERLWNRIQYGRHIIEDK